MKELDLPVQPKDLSPYAGRWIAHIGDQIISQGGTPGQALRAAQASRFKEIPEINYIPPAQPLEIHPLLEKIAAIIPADIPIYIVGGAVRDALLRQPVREMDFIVPADAIQHARKIANQLGAAFYVLDNERDYGRVLVSQAGDHPLVLDFAPLQGADLEADLVNRDFTINAIAAGITPPFPRYDPLGGANDLLNKRLRSCTPGAIANDPIRILRGVRFSIKFELKAEQATKIQMRAAAELLPNTSAERLRDELFKLLDTPKPDAAMRVLQQLGALKFVLPELVELQRVEQSRPHIHNGWEHTLEVVKQLKNIWLVLRPSYNPDSTSSLFMGVITHRLGRYREQLANHLQESLVPYRSITALNILAALYHDIGKPTTQKEEEEGQYRFINHEKVGADVVARRAAELQLSIEERMRLKIIVRHHMRPLWLAQNGELPSRRAIYRFFRDTQTAGVDICLLSLADTLGTYGYTLPADIWKHQVDVVRTLMEAWWEHKDQQVFPPPLVNGNELISKFNLKPGPIIGQLLSEIQEAQAIGVVNNQRQAYEHASRVLLEIENEAEDRS
jgi:putative nucleotidyltransferase with HDIG domain